MPARFKHSKRRLHSQRLQHVPDHSGRETSIVRVVKTSASLVWHRPGRRPRGGTRRVPPRGALIFPHAFDVFNRRLASSSSVDDMTAERQATFRERRRSRPTLGIVGDAQTPSAPPLFNLEELSETT